ncbi:MAG: nickel pincer cofactor biosynthesis protein LarC [Acidobacteria bacterium]|nr:nickel pincer cofactor biosynthesis protein LarC [Acidobacteriota bacterium]
MHTTGQKLLFFEPFSGISGDMVIGALLDLGFSFEELRDKLKLLPLKGYELSATKTVRSGIQATKFDVQADDSHSHRNFSDIRKMIESSGLSSWVQEKSIDAFRRLAEAEGKVHGESPDKVHFHEVGAVDSIVDIVGTMIAMEPFAHARIASSPVNIGQGTLECRHGIYPVPGPAAQELLKGVPVFSNAVTGELTTPTGAALVVTLAGSFGACPPMKIESAGYGAGTRKTPGNANVLRVSVGEAFEQTAASPEEEVAVITATIDDMSPQVYGYFQETALAAGALDIYCIPIQMKKNRPGLMVSCVCACRDVDRLAKLIFRETTTIGIRYTFARRKTLQRQFVQVETRFGPVSMKVSLLEGSPVNFIPEFEDCRRLAAEQGVALKEIQAAALRAYLQNVAQKPE